MKNLLGVQQELSLDNPHSAVAFILHTISPKSSVLISLFPCVSEVVCVRAYVGGWLANDEVTMTILAAMAVLV